MARRFVFRFDTILKIRRQREDERKRIVAERVRQITESRARMAELQQQIDAQMNAIRATQETGTIDMPQVVRHRHWLGHLHKNLLDEQARIGFLEAKLAQERAALGEASKQRKVLDTLKERQQDRHQRAEAKAETAAADELATVRYVFTQRAAVDWRPATT